MRTHTDLDWIDEHVRAFDEGHACAPVDARVVHVSGTDARRWLDDLVTAGVGSLADGAQARSLLLSPTGRIRADLHVVADGGAFLLVQALDQPRPIRDVLGPYVLSSDVRLEDVPDARVHVRAADPDPRVVVDGDAGDDVPAEIFEVWRIRRGLARFPVDVDADSTPAEGGLDRLVDVTKGCFLGQEAVAKIRNLGHPARVTLGLFAPAGTTVGDEVTTQGRLVGTITSVAPARRGCDVIARVAWRDRVASLACPSGPLTSA
jgi:tRNA-modifying protein YgfZ